MINDYSIFNIIYHLIRLSSSKVINQFFSGQTQRALKLPGANIDFQRLAARPYYLGKLNRNIT
jgi:hypothetical protein